MRRIAMMLLDLLLRIKWRLRSGARISLLSVFTASCRFGKNARVERMCVLHDVELGDFSYLGDNSRVVNAEIGRFCSVSGSVQIGLGRHPIDLVSTSPVFFSNHNAVKTHWVEKELAYEEYRKVTIGSDVWIGTRAMVCDGVTVGNGAIIGAGSIVTKDVEPYAVVAGSPARLLRKRFDEETIQKLEALRWWEWPSDQLRENIALFTDVDEFRRKFLARPAK